MTEKTAEQVAADATKAQEKERLKAEREQAKAQKKAERDAAKEKSKAAKAEAKEAKKAEKAKQKEEAKAAKDANRMPIQNDIRRPKETTLCGKAWAVFDSVSSKNGSPAAIGECLELTRAQGLNDGNVRTEYARWRKFHGISGRIAAPATEQAAA